MKSAHLLSLLDLDRPEFDSIMAESARWKQGKGQPAKSQPAKSAPMSWSLRRVATIFDGPG